jgi:hypothetical protein
MKTGIAKVKCTCVHEIQDKLHGAQNRIANTTAKQDNDTVEVRCTVCKKTQRVNIGVVK